MRHFPESEIASSLCLDQSDRFVLPIAAPVPLLFALRLPLTVVRFVAEVVVDPAQAVSLARSFAHVCMEHAEVSPTLADGNAASSIIGEVFAFGIVGGTSDHCGPGTIRYGSGHAVLLFGFQRVHRPADRAGLLLVR